MTVKEVGTIPAYMDTETVRAQLARWIAERDRSVTESGRDYATGFVVLYRAELARREAA
jgi:hypothetical protein